MEGNYFLEEVESIISLGIVWEVCERGWSWPGQDRDQSNADDHGRFNFVHDEQGGDNASEEYADPDLLDGTILVHIAS